MPPYGPVDDSPGTLLERGSFPEARTRLLLVDATEEKRYSIEFSSENKKVLSTTIHQAGKCQPDVLKFFVHPAIDLIVYLS
jgi:hypothetical protein